jgi:hypothetical protein
MKLYALLFFAILPLACYASGQQSTPAQVPVEAQLQAAVQMEVQMEVQKEVQVIHPSIQAPAHAPAASTSAPEAMAAFSFFIGSWQPVLDPAAPPPNHTEIYTFAPILDGTFLISQEIYRDSTDKIIYRDFGVYGIDPDTHKLFVHAYNSDGSIDRTRGIDSPPGQFVFLGTVYGSKRFRDYRYTMTKLNDDHMRILIELLKDGKFDKLSEKIYERKSKEASTTVQ